MHKKILADLQICIRVPLTVSTLKPNPFICHEEFNKIPETFVSLDTFF